MERQVKRAIFLKSMKSCETLIIVILHSVMMTEDYNDNIEDGDEKVYSSIVDS